MPEDSISLNHELAGLIRNSAAGSIDASVWVRPDDNTQLLRHYVEDDSLRLVFSKPDSSKPAAKQCEYPQRLEMRIAVKGLEQKRGYRLQAEFLRESRVLADNVAVEVTQAVDCGGQIFEEAQAAELAKSPLTVMSPSNDALKVTVYAQHNGTALDPKFVMEGKVIEAGYAEREFGGAMAPACMFSDRINFVFKGPLPKDVSVRLIADRRGYGMYAIAAALALLAAAGFLKLLLSRRKRPPSPQGSQP